MEKQKILPEAVQGELICVIVNYGHGSKVIKSAKKTGITGGTIFLGKGTAQNRILKFLDLSDIRKEIVLMVSTKEKVLAALEELNKELKLEKPNHGIAFSIPVKNFFGLSKFKKNDVDYKIEENRGVDNTMYNVIFVIVDKGKAEDVIDAATKAGSTGGTIINARGSGIHETSMLFSMAIEPEKEVVMILSKTTLTEAIVESIRSELKIDDPGNGILFIQNVNKAYGLYEG
jgi:nitrogen regulatory protein PII